MTDSGGADTWGCEMLITSAVAILFSCSDWDTDNRSQSLKLFGRATWALVIWRLFARVLFLILFNQYARLPRKVPSLGKNHMRAAFGRL
jgi:hypothetical protein